MKRHPPREKFGKLLDTDSGGGIWGTLMMPPLSRHPLRPVPFERLGPFDKLRISFVLSEC